MDAKNKEDRVEEYYLNFLTCTNSERRMLNSKKALTMFQ